MHTLLHRSRVRVAAAALALGATAAVTQAAPTAAAPAPTSASATATSSLPCGFHLGYQSYRNCSRTYVHRVSATAHESLSGRTVTYYYCFKPGTSKQPLAVWGMVVYNVYVKVSLAC